MESDSFKNVFLTILTENRVIIRYDKRQTDIKEKQRKKQTNKRQAKHNLLGGGECGHQCSNYRLKTSRPTIRTQRLITEDTPMTISAITTVSNTRTATVNSQLDAKTMLGSSTFTHLECGTICLPTSSPHRHRISRQPVLDCGTIFHPDCGGRDFPLIFSDDL